MIEDSEISPDVRARALQISDLSNEQIYREYGHIPQSKEVALIEALAQLVGDPTFPSRAGLRMRRRTGSVLIYLVFQSDTLLEAMQMVERFLVVVRPTLGAKLETTPDFHRLNLLFYDEKFGVPDAYLRWAMAAFASVLREATGHDDIPMKVELSGHYPSMPTEWIGPAGVPLRQRSEHNTLIVSREMGQRPILSADSVLKSYLLEVAERARAEKLQSNESEFVSKVLQIVQEQLHNGAPSVSQVASRFNVSTRSFQRRLSEEGFDFTSLVASLRLTMAKDLLSGRHTSIAEISIVLGFSDQSHFTKFFKKQTGGLSPSQFSKKRR